MDTIFALATATGKSGVAVIRISGSAAHEACKRLGVCLSDHDRRLVSIRNLNGEFIDQAFALSFAKGRSFTGESVIELHTHGSPAIVSSVLRLLASVGLRQAEPGEFTRRALENGILDLAQVEGLADLIDAETEAQRKQAVKVFRGALGDLVEAWRKKIIRATALLEATIDFADEEVPEDVFPEVTALLYSVRSEICREAEGVSIRERLRDGFEIALVGAPNVGKSTLLNYLAGRDAAMTSSIPGTTRDVIEVRMDLFGLPVTFLDTAGLRETDDALERLGIDRGKERAELADIRIGLLDELSDWPDNIDKDVDFLVCSKGDVGKSVPGVMSISGKTGLGVDNLLLQIQEALEKKISGSGIAMRARHEISMREALDILEEVLIKLNDERPMVDFVAEDLRRMILKLDILVGRVDVEDLLGEIFSSFCIGK